MDKQTEFEVALASSFKGETLVQSGEHEQQLTLHIVSAISFRAQNISRTLENRGEALPCKIKAAWKI